MAEDETKVPVKTGGRSSGLAPQGWWPFESLRRDMDRLFDDFAAGLLSPLRRSPFDFGRFWPGSEVTRSTAPVVDVVEKDNRYEITAELPGLERSDVEVNLKGDVLTIKGHKREEREEKKADYHVSERRYGSFQRSFRMPDTVDTDKIGASFKNGVLTLTLPKSPEALKKPKKIEVKT